MNIPPPPLRSRHDGFIPYLPLIAYALITMLYSFYNYTINTKLRQYILETADIHGRP